MFKNLFFLVISIFMLIGCGGGGGGSSGSISQTINGVAQLGYISGAKINLYNKKNLNTIIASTSTSLSENIEDAGSFKLEGIELANDEYYILEVVGGYDIDPDDNGIIDSTSKVELKGKVYSIVKGSDLLTGTTRITALSDMAYLKLKENLLNLTNIEIETKLNKFTSEYLYDINEDNIVDIKDLNHFNPISHKAKTKKSYTDILNLYIPKLHNGEADSSKLSSLLYLDEPKIIVKNGNLQEIPFNLNTSIENLPENLKVKWFLDNTEKEILNEEITVDNIYNITAKIYSSEKIIKTVMTTLIATKNTELVSKQALKSENTTIEVVQSESNDSFIGATVTIPANSLSEDTTIILKKSSINTIPTNNQTISISDVLVLEPSGLTFEKPVQIRMPYDENIDLINETVKVARYSNGVVDYILPLYIDYENHEVVFETEHFTEFQIHTDWIGNSDEEKFINALNQEFNYDLSIQKWKSILNVPISQSSLTVYDYLKIYIDNKRIYEIIKQNAILDKDTGMLLYGKKYDFEYINALEIMYPNSSKYSEEIKRWGEIKKGFELINAIQTGSSVLNSLLDEKYVIAILDLIGIPTSPKDLTFYNPVKLGSDFIKSVIDVDNNKNIGLLLNNVSFDTGTNLFEYSDSFENDIKSFLDNKNIREMSENVIRRYKTFDYNEDYQDALLLIKEVEENFKSIDEIAKIKNNPTSNFDNYTKILDVKANGNSKLTIPIKIETKGYTKSNFTPIFELRNSNDNKLIKKLDTPTLTFTKIDEINGLFEGNIIIDTPSSDGVYEYKLYYEVNDLTRIDDNSSQKINLTVKTKKNITVTGLIFEDKGFTANGNYVGLINPTFNSYDDLKIKVKFTINNEDYNNLFSIKKEDFTNSSLSNLEITILPTKSILDSYNITLPSTLTFNLKAKIDRALDDLSNEEPNEAKNNKPTTMGQTVTLNQDTTKAITLIASDIDKNDTLTYVYSEPKYGKLSGTAPNLTYTPPTGYSGPDSFSFKVYDKVYDGEKEVYSNISIVSIIVNEKEAENNKPTTMGQTVTLNQDTTKAITLSGSDANDDVLSYFIMVQPSHGTLSGTAPNLTYTPESEYSGEDSFTFKVNDGKIDSNSSTVSINVNKVINKQITFISQSVPADNSVVLRGSSFVKSWTFKNSGNVDLSNLKVETVNAPSGLTATINQNVSSSLKQNATTTYALNISVPSNLQEGTYEAKYKLTDSNVDLKYPNGEITYFTYKFIVPKPNDFKAYAYLSSSTYSTNENALLSVVLNDGNKPYQISINWGDGTSLTTAQITEQSQVKNFTHKYLVEGNYTITTNITDSMGKTAQVNNSVTIKDSVDSITKWSVSGADLITNTNQENIDVQIIDESTHSVYTTSWIPQSTSDDYWITYKLPIPRDLIKMTNKLRVTFVGKAGELEDYDRVITFALSDGKNYSYNFMTNINNESGFIRIKDYQGTDTKQLVSSLTDSSVLVRQNDRAYAIENSYLGTSNNSTLSAYKFANSSYTSLSSTSQSITATNTLKELQINFKGNGTISLLKLEYDKNGDGNYSSDETMILNTDSLSVDWSSFIDENNEESEQISYVIDDGISDTKVTFKAEDNITNIDVPSDAWVRLVPKSYADVNNYSMSIRCKIQSDGTFENNCFIYSEQKSDFDRVLADENETYQVAVFKNHVNVDDKHWEANEDLYKYVGDNESNWSDIVVLKENYQNNTQSNETITSGVFTYGIVTSPITGKRWLDRNLGATRVCTSSTDTACYGDYYQWGRNTDGHEKLNSEITTIQASTLIPEHNKFIIHHSDWTSTDSNGSYRSINWNQCPIGFRIPTIEEFDAEGISNDKNIKNKYDAFNSFLKLPSSGIRGDIYMLGRLESQGYSGSLYIVPTNEEGYNTISYHEDNVSFGLHDYATGMPIRCIKSNDYEKDSSLSVEFSFIPELIHNDGTKSFGELIVTFNKDMKPGYGTSGEYIPTASYWKTNRQFVIDFESYTSGALITLNAESFLSAESKTLANNVSFTFP